MSYRPDRGYQDDPYANNSAGYEYDNQYGSRGEVDAYQSYQQEPYDLGQPQQQSSVSLIEPDEKTLLKYYQLETLNPVSWKDSTAKEFMYDPDDTEDVDKAYDILKSLSENPYSLQSEIVDEPDPLGYFSSVSQALLQKGVVKSPDDPAKQGYFIGSKTFNSILFLRHLHDADSFNNMSRSLDYLDLSIAKQSQQLRHLIKSEFIRFVKSKTSLDGVFEQINTTGLINGQGSDAGKEIQSSSSASTKDNPLNSLSDNLTLANSKASVIIKPIVDNKKKENNLKNALSIVETNKYLFDLPRTLSNNLDNNDYESLSVNYNKGRDMYHAFMNDSAANRESVASATSNANNSSLGLASKRLLDRVWEEVEAIVDSYKRELWNKLADTNSSDNAYVSIISKLLELGVEDNPIVVWINTQFNSLTNEINTNFQKLFENIISIQKHIFETINATDITFLYYLQGALNSSISSTNADKLNKLSHGLVDSPEIIEMWLIIKKLIDDTVVLFSGKIKLYWNVCELFLNNKVQAALPKGYKDESEVHLKLEDYEKERIIRNGEELVSLLSANFERFLNTTQKDLVLLENPASDKLRDSNDIDSAEYEIKAPQSYGFIPPYANSISTIRYLEKFMVSIFISYNSLGNLDVSAKAVETLKQSYSKILKKFIVGICSTWANDVSFFNTLEDYRIINMKNELNHSNDLIISNVTEAKSNYISFNDIDSHLTLPELILIYEKFVIKSLRDILFVDLKSGNNIKDASNIKIFTKPNDKFFNSIQTQFSKNLEILLISMMKKVTNENKGKDDKESFENTSSFIPSGDKKSELLSTKTSTLDLYELWTLDNFIELEDRILGQIVAYYDEVFKTKLSRTNLDVLSHLLPKLQKATFNNYCELKKTTLTSIIKNGVSKAFWGTQIAPTKVSGYVYECFTYLVILHSTIAKVSKSLICTIIHELQNHITTMMYENLKIIKEFSTSGLQQLAIDVEFFKSIFKNPNYKLGKTANANLNLIVLKIIKSRSDPEMILNSVSALVNNSVQHSKLTYACFYQK